MGFPEYPSLYFDTLVQLFIVIERWLYRYAIRRRTRAILDLLYHTSGTEAFFTVPVLDEDSSYTNCYFLATWACHIREGYDQRRSLYLTQTGGFLVQVEPRQGTRGDLQRLHPDDGLTAPVLRRLYRALGPAYSDAMLRCRDYDWEKGEYITW